MAMKITTDGIVIRDLSFRGKDRLLTILTRDTGVIRAYAKGARALRGPMLAATELLAYSRFVLFFQKDRYSVDCADGEALFFGLRQDLVKLSLGSYMAELCAELIPEGEGSEDFLRLMLNSLYLLEKGKREAAFLKPVFELRLLSMAGYMPDLVACQGCARFEADPMYFLPQTGQLFCPDCRPQGTAEAVPLAPAVLAAMRHILYSPFDRLFGFSLSPQGLAVLGQVTQNYLLRRTERSFPSLEFYQSVAAMG